jgi:hypothetical protein
MEKHLTTLLAVVLFCGLLVSVSQRHPGMVSGADAASAKAPAKPAPKPKPKPKRKRKSLLPTPAEEKELLGFLHKNRREFYNSLMVQKKASDKRYRGTMQFAWQWYKRYKSLDLAVRKEVDREQGARIDISKVLGKLKKVKSENDRKKLLSDLTRLGGVQFDAQMRITKYKLDQTSNQLRRLRKELQNRQAERKKIVAQRVQCWLKASAKSAKPKGSNKKK